MNDTKDQIKKVRRKRYTERPDVRVNLLNAAEELIRTDGYAAATARNIASRAGMKHQAVFYYFGSQEELLVEVLRRAALGHRQRLKEALNSGNPIHALWEFHRDPDVTRTTLEFMALANHSEPIRAELAKNAEVDRKMETEAIEQYLNERGVEKRLSSQMVSILTSAMARLIVQEEGLGIHIGHAEAIELSENSFAAFETMGGTSQRAEIIVKSIERRED